MALGKNISSKSNSDSNSAKKKVSKDSAVSEKIQKKKLISKPSRTKLKKHSSSKNNPLIRYITEENQQRKEKLRYKYIEEVSALKDQKVQFIVFKVGNEEFGIEIDRINEVVPFTGIAEIPKSPKHIIGATRARNQTIMAIDLQAKFQSNLTLDYQYTVALKNSHHKIGILLNELPVALKVDGAKINASLHDLETTIEDETYIKGIIELEDRLIFYLDIDGLIQGDKAIVVPNEMVEE